jgi:hypothetical protein
MNTITKYCLWAVVGAILLIAPAALADGSASMDLTSSGSNTVNGMFVGPYTATINGVSTLVVCDDFADESFVGETWTATVTTLSDLTGTKWGNSTKGYDEMAWLLTQMFATNSKSTQADIQFAIWEVFDKDSFDSIFGSTLAGAESWLKQAKNQTYYAGEFGDITIYTPNTHDPIRCSGKYCADTPPQEFLTVTQTPEPSTLLLFGSGLAIFGFLMRRKLAGAASVQTIA